MKKETKTAAFSKAAILHSKIFINNRDLLDAVLDENKEYSLKEVSDILKKTLEREVK